MKDTLTVGFLPWWPQNPYQILLKRELNQLGIRVIGNPPLSLLRILFRRDELDVVHIHWPHGLYLEKPWTFPYILLTLLLYRLIKNNIVWTVHELDFYETKIPALDRIMRVVLMKTCRALFVHGTHSIREIKERYAFPRRITVTYHPSYEGYYPDDTSRENARARFGISPTQKVFLFFGYIKPYKGVEDLIEAFQKNKEPDSVLLIAGKPLDKEIKNRITALAKQDDRIRTDLRYISDSEIHIYFNAADIVVFPFRKTQTSGSIMLALTFGKPVIAPALATIPEYVDENMAILFDANDADGLQTALTQSGQRDLTEMGVAAKHRATILSWQDMALKHQAVYHEVAERNISLQNTCT